MNSAILNLLIVDTLLTTDSRSDKEDSEKESHFEGITDNTTDRKRKRTEGNAAVYNVRIKVRCQNHSKMCE